MKYLILFTVALSLSFCKNDKLKNELKNKTVIKKQRLTDTLTVDDNKYKNTSWMDYADSFSYFIEPTGDPRTAITYIIEEFDATSYVFKRNSYDDAFEYMCTKRKKDNTLQLFYKSTVNGEDCNSDKPLITIYKKNNEFEYSDISDYLPITEKPNNITTSQSVINKCSYEKLLKNRTISVEAISNNPSQNLKIIIDNKTNNNTQEINYKPYSFDFGCNSSIFYDNISLHNDYEIIAGDFNFDLLQDFAILYDKTINTGTVFTYFFQNKKGEFYQNKEFPLKLIPSKIDKKNKTLTQHNIVGCCKIGTSIYQLKNNKWVKIFSEIEELK